MPSAAIENARVATGLRAFEQLGCAACHAIGGMGNRTAHSMALAAAAMQTRSTPGRSVPERHRVGCRPPVVRLKSRAADAPELPALIEYLVTLK